MNTSGKQYFKYNFSQVKKSEEFNSFIIRFILGSVASIFGGVGLYFDILHLPIPLYITISSSFYLFTFTMFISLFHNLASPIRRYFTLFFDISFTSISIYATAGETQVLWLFYVWLYIGYGSRYGKNYLYAAAIMSLAQYALVLLVSGMWQNNLLDIAIHILILLTLPIYILSMIKRLHLAKIEALKIGQLKSQFLASMSHEIRTPLNGIIGTSLLLSKTKLSSEQQKYTKALSYSSEMLLNLINDILDFSKINANKIKLNKDTINMKQCIEKVSQSLLFIAQQKNLTLTSEVSKNIPENLIGDQKRLIQILLNLVGNAIKFTQKGHVDINVSIDKSQGKFYTLLFKIKDTGIGISAEDQSFMFQRFTQVGKISSQSGTGLGTTISNELVELMGGSIKLKSELGKGCEVSFSIKFKQAKPIKKNNVVLQKHEPITKKFTILIAEDDDINAMVLEQFLAEQGHKTNRVSNGKEVLYELKKTHYPIIFMDLHMPELSGLQTTQEIRKQNSQTIIIGLTANATTEQKELCLTTGMDDFLTKPITPQKLMETLAKY